MRLLKFTPQIALLLTLTLALGACDGNDPAEDEVVPAAHFTAEVTAPINATLAGSAAAPDSLAPGALGAEGFIRLPLGGGEVELTTLLFTSEEPSGHILALTRLGRDSLTTGTYDAGGLLSGFCFQPGEECAEEEPRDLLDGSSFTAHYTRATVDSMQSFQISGGTVEIETVTEEQIAGSFRLEASRYSALSFEALRAFSDALEDLEPGELPPFPEMTTVELDAPLGVDGAFDASRLASPPR